MNFEILAVEINILQALFPKKSAYSSSFTMDIFRLLSRSSGLQKKSTINSTATIGSNLPVPRSGKKRKLGSAATTSATIDDAPPELDFFSIGGQKGDGNESNKKRKRAIKCGGDDTESDPDSDGADDSDQEQKGLLDDILSAESAASTLPPPTAEEIYKLMKEHKLKVTLLNPPPPPPSTADDKDKNRKKKKAKAEPEPEAVSASSKKKAKQSDIQPQTLLTSFNQLRPHPYTVSKRLYLNLMKQGYKTPTPVQMASIPILLVGHEGAVEEGQENGRRRTENPANLLTCAPTGSGKTLAYLLPLIDWVLWKRAQVGKDGLQQKKFLKGVILAPTKELVGQIHNEALKLVAGTGVRVSVLKKAVVGKIDMEDAGENGSEVEKRVGDGDGHPAVTKIKSDIVFSTPTMFLHAVQKGMIELSGVERLILDEADVLLENSDSGNGFGDQTMAGWEKLLQSHGLDTKHGGIGNIRIWMWSATISSGVEEMVGKMMCAPLPTPAKDENDQTEKKKKKSQASAPAPTPALASPPLLRLLVGLKNTSLPNINHRLTYTATERGKLLSLRTLFTTAFPPPCLIFLQTIPRAIALHEEILYDLPIGRIEVLHSNLSDNKREEIMDRFRRGEIWVLVTTDLLSRGVDWRGVNVIVNYDIPTSAAGYIHRAGRTGRAGREGGIVHTYYTKEDIKFVKPIANVIAQAEKMAHVGSEGGAEDGVQWILDYLPKVKKEDRKRLKKYGVENRNQRKVVKEVDDEDEGEKGKKKKVVVIGKARQGISTVGGWEKQKNDKRKAAVEASKRRKRIEKEEGSDGGENDDGAEEEWGGI